MLNHSTIGMQVGEVPTPLLLDYLQQTPCFTPYLTFYFKLYSVNSVIYIAKQYFVRSFTWLAGDGLSPKI
jgi:hypothetical protein